MIVAHYFRKTDTLFFNYRLMMASNNRCTRREKPSMYQNKSICVVVPAHNEETQIAKVIQTMPDYVDAIVIIDDAIQIRTVESR